MRSARGFRFASKKWILIAKARTFKKKHNGKATKKAKEGTSKDALCTKATTKNEMSDLPMELAEDVLSRLSLTSLRVVRSTCKSWNTLFKYESFTKKLLAQAKASDLMVVLVLDFKVFLMGLHLHKGVDPSVNLQAKLISLDDSNSDPQDISHVYHCDGLLLCIIKDIARFVVWNPYTCQTLWLGHTTSDPKHQSYKYAIGYGNTKSGRIYKILRYTESSVDNNSFEYEIYNINFDSWKTLNFARPSWDMDYYARGISIKGNAYCFAQERYGGSDFLVCFNFTRESFGPRLALPFHSKNDDTITLSSVRDEQLAVLFQPFDSLQMEIWVTATIQPRAVSWSSKVFLSVNMTPLTNFPFIVNASFFIDEEKKVVVVFDKDKNVMNPTRNIAYVIGEDGYFREVDLGKSVEDDPNYYPVACSYVPSAVQI